MGGGGKGKALSHMLTTPLHHHTTVLLSPFRVISLLPEPHTPFTSCFPFPGAHIPGAGCQGPGGGGNATGTRP